MCDRRIGEAPARTPDPGRAEVSGTSVMPNESVRMIYGRTCPLATAALSGHLLVRFNPVQRQAPRVMGETANRLREI